MTTLLAFAFMLLIVTAMAIGVLFGRRPIEGSCGGMNRLGLDTACEICGGDRARCPEVATETKTDLAVDVMADQPSVGN
jgi:hypothetical protein